MDQVRAANYFIESCFFYSVQVSCQLFNECEISNESLVLNDGAFLLFSIVSLKFLYCLSKNLKRIYLLFRRDLSVALLDVLLY